MNLKVLFKQLFNARSSISTSKLNTMKLSTFSHSAIDTYRKCGELYKYSYIDKVVPSSAESYFELGTFIHGALEGLYLDFYKTPEEGFYRYLPVYLKEENLSELEPDILAIIDKLSNLYVRASEDYLGKDAIRNKGNGKQEGPARPVSKVPTQTTDWKSALIAEGIDVLRNSVNQRAARQVKFVNIALTDVIGECHYILKKYKHPSWYKETIPGMVEIAFSTRDETGTYKNLVEWPNQPNTYISGVIDLVARNHNSQIVIVDHKTGQDTTNTSLVQHNSQLNIYAYAWFKLTGDWPDFISINNAKTGSNYIAPVEPQIALDIVYNRSKYITDIINKRFIKEAPSDYNSPCVKCPMLHKCHPLLNI